jgi:hypothetical protein
MRHDLLTKVCSDADLAVEMKPIDKGLNDNRLFDPVRIRYLNYMLKICLNEVI